MSLFVGYSGAGRAAITHNQRITVRLTLLAAAAMSTAGVWAQNSVSPGITAPASAAATLVNLDIPAQPLAQALNALALQTNARIVFATELTDQKTAPAVKGALPLREALDRLLVGSGLRARQEGQTLTVERVPVAAPVAAAQADKSLATVTVTESADVPGVLPKPFAGGQVARGGRIGVLGNADILDTPFSVTSFTSEFKDDLQAKSVAELLRFAPSVQTPQLQASTQNDILFLRGFLTVSGFGNFDGLPGLLNRQLPIEPIDRIELLLGASAFANGRPAAVGGTINLVPKRADDKPLTRVGLDFVGQSNFGPTLDLGRRFGVDNAWGIRVNAAYSDGELSVNDAEKRVALGSLALDYRSDRLRWTFDHIAQRRKQSPFGSTAFGLAPGLAVPSAPNGDQILSPVDGVYDRRFRLTATRLDWQISPAWSLTTAYGLSRDTELPNTGLDRPTVTNTAGDAQVTTFVNTAGRQKLESGELVLRGNFQTGSITHKLSLGSSRFTADGFSSFIFSTIPTINTNIFNPVRVAGLALPAQVGLPAFKTSDSVTRGVFISDELGFFNDRLLLTLGLRNTRIETNSFNGSTGARTGGFVGKDTTPAIGLVFKVSPSFSVYANSVEALENGATAPNTAVNAGQQFPPLVSKQVEVGAKKDFGKLAVTAALFRIERASQFTDPRTNRFAQDGLQTNTGLELAVFGELQRGLRVYSGFSAINGKLKRTANGSFDGKDAPDVPDYTLTANLDWDVPGVPGLALQGALVRNGKQFFDNANTQVVPAWTRFDLGLRYVTAVAGRKTVFRFKVENAADKNYLLGDRGGLNVASPRTFLLSATVDF